jgi:hypothetical protein
MLWINKSREVMHKAQGKKGRYTIFELSTSICAKEYPEPCFRCRLWDDETVLALWETTKTTLEDAKKACEDYDDLPDKSDY